ncbi:MAG: methyltransferase domain-containing protein [Planctomycetota bacterium]
MRGIIGTRPPIESGYDELMYWAPLREYYGHSDFVNYGYWEPGIANARAACENLVEKLLAFIPEKDGTILDVACGKGATTQHLLHHYAPTRVTAIDRADKQIKLCQEKLPDCRFMVMDATALEFEDDSFDNILSVEAAFHFVPRLAFLREARRVLRPGGRLVLSDMLMTRAGEAERRLGSVENHVPDLDAYRELCREAGFSEVAVEDVTEPCLHGTFDHLVQFSHSRLLSGEISVEELQTFTRRFFGLVPDLRYYLLACLRA